jgi:hypothetical protein
MNRKSAKMTEQGRKLMKMGIIIGLVLAVLIPVGVLAGDLRVPLSEDTTGTLFHFLSPPVRGADIRPVTAATSFTHSQTLWSTNSFVLEQWTGDVYSSYHSGYRYHVNLNSGGGITWVTTTFTAPGSIDGIVPSFRYVTWRLEMPAGVNATGVEFSNGSGFVSDKSLKFTGKNKIKTYTLDLGQYYLVENGIQVSLYIINDNAAGSYNDAIFYGTGAKIEY